MKNKIEVNTIIISDIHLGTKYSKAKECLKFLNNYQFNNLFLNGDIVDGWALSRGSKWNKSHTKFIRKILKYSQQNINVIWVKGNHDEFLNNLLNINLGGIKIVKDYNYKSITNNNYWITHGDVFDVFIKKYGWLAKIGSIGYDLALWINEHYNKWRKLRGKEYFSLSKLIKNKVKSAASFIGDFENTLTKLAVTKKYDGVICGHIHHPENKIINNIHYLNSGDWVENNTAIIEHLNGEFEIVYYKD